MANRRRKLGKVTCGELLDDVLVHLAEGAKDSTPKIWKLVIEANVRPFFGHLKASSLTTERMREYRKKENGRAEPTRPSIGRFRS